MLAELLAFDRAADLTGGTVLTAIGLLSTTFGVSVASALFPLISIEVFVIGLVMNGSTVPWWLLAVVIALGQIGGKLLYYYSAQGVIRLPRFLRREAERERKGRWRAWLHHFRERCHHRPVWSGGMLLLSAVTSLPPFAATSVVAGWARVRLSTFLITGFVGRFLRFAALAIAPGFMVAWL